MVYPRWKCLPVIPTKAAMSELYKLCMGLEDVVEILENGEPSGARRKKGTHEICLARRGKPVKVVVALSYNFSLKTDCRVLVHVGEY